MGVFVTLYANIHCATNVISGTEANDWGTDLSSLYPHTCLQCLQTAGQKQNKHSTFRQGLDDTSKEALKVRLCWVVRIVRGLLGRLLSRSSDRAPLPVTLADSSSSSSSSSSSPSPADVKETDTKVKFMPAIWDVQCIFCIWLFCDTASAFGCLRVPECFLTT